MSAVGTLVTPSRVTKLGRPTLRKNGIPLTAAEKQARYRARLKRERRYRARCPGPCEWYTPAEYIEAARKVLGGIDLDPASCEIAQTVVGASAFFSVEDDGLVQEWRGRVFLNPPYSRGLITRFVDKLLLELRAGRVQQAILLVNADTDTKWFHRAAAASASICFTKRIRFWGPNGDGKSPTTGSAFFYFGPNVEQFSAAFEGFGMIR